MSPGLGPFKFEHDGIEWRVAIGDQMTGRTLPPMQRGRRAAASWVERKVSDGAIPSAIQDQGAYYHVWFTEAGGPQSKFQSPFMMGKADTEPLDY